MKNKNKILISAVICIVLFLIVNQIDAPVPPGYFTRQDLNPDYFGKDNGYYIIAAFTEPFDKDPGSEKMINKYRGLFDRKLDNKYYWNLWSWKEYRKDTAKYYKYIFFLEQNRKTWIDFVITEKERIKKTKQDLAVLLKRYRNLIEKKIVSDFTRYWFRINGKILLGIARLFTALEIERFINKNKMKAVHNLLKQVNLGKKIIKNARNLFLNKTGKDILKISIRALINLMNHKTCNKEIYRAISSDLKPLHYADYGSRNSLISYCLRIKGYLEYKTSPYYSVDEDENTIQNKIKSAVAGVVLLFYQKQRTVNYFFRYVQKCIKNEKKPVYQWDPDFKRHYNLMSGAFWWVQNGVGKLLFSKHIRPSFYNHLLNSYSLKALYEMAKISAELHYAYKTNKLNENQLKEIIAKTNDPFCGQAYRMDLKNRIIYSVGFNQRDDGGVFDLQRYPRHNPPDISLPLHIKKK